MAKKRKRTSTTLAGERRPGKEAKNGEPSHKSPCDDMDEAASRKRLKVDHVDSGHQSPSSVVAEPSTDDNSFSCLSLEIICHILDFLSIWDVMKMECQCRHLQQAVSMHLRLLSDVDFTEGEIHGWMPDSFTDETFAHFLKRCPDLIFLYGLHPKYIAKRRQRGSKMLSIPGVIDALRESPCIQGVETCDMFLLEAVLNYLPEVEILGTFKNRDGIFPILPSNSITITRNPQITSLNLTGVEIPDLPRMDFLKTLHMKWVYLTDAHPFRDFVAPMLKTFVMNNCAGPLNALKYVPLVTGLVASRSLSRLELVRVPFLGGLIQHVVEDSWRVRGFRNLKKIVMSACKHALEVDLGYLMMTCANVLEELYMQPSLTKDSFFYSMMLAEPDFSHLYNLHLGYVDEFPEPGKWDAQELAQLGLSDYMENPAYLTDFGMKVIGQVFPALTTLSVYNCPHLHNATAWFTPGGMVCPWDRLTDLHLRRCHAVNLADFCKAIPLMPSLETLYLEDMFKEPPKGCSRY